MEEVRRGAPRGSFYFHFPDGKDQLVLTALERAAAATLLSLTEPLADGAGDLGRQVRTIFTAIETDLLANDYAPGCAVAVTTVESASTSTRFQQAVSAAFTTWTSALTDSLSRRGLSPDRAAALSDAIVSAAEGASILATRVHTPYVNHGITIARLITSPAESPSGLSRSGGRRQSPLKGPDDLIADQVEWYLSSSGDELHADPAQKPEH